MDYETSEEPTYENDWGYSMNNHPWRDEGTMSFISFPKKLAYSSAEVTLESVKAGFNDLKEILDGKRN